MRYPRQFYPLRECNEYKEGPELEVLVPVLCIQYVLRDLISKISDPIELDTIGADVRQMQSLFIAFSLPTGPKNPCRQDLRCNVDRQTLNRGNAIAPVLWLCLILITQVLLIGILVPLCRCSSRECIRRILAIPR